LSYQLTTFTKLPRPIVSTAEKIELWGSPLSAIVREEIGKHLAAAYDEGIAPWKNGYPERPVYTAWQEAAAVDRRLELLGVTGFRRFVAGLPSQPLEALATLLAHLRVPLALRERLLAATALAVPGWAAWTRYRELAAARRGAACDDFAALVAIRLAYDTAIAEAPSDSDRLAGRRARRAGLGWHSAERVDPQLPVAGRRGRPAAAPAGQPGGQRVNAASGRPCPPRVLHRCAL